MPTSRKNTPKKGAPAQTGSGKSTGNSSDLPADQPAAVAPEPEAVESAEVVEDAVPLNRAERRAKGKTHGQVQMTGRGKVARSTGPAAGPRMWANRRSG